jgi:hypothetical protein
MLGPEKRTLLLTGNNYTLWAFWMREYFSQKRSIYCSEDENILYGLFKKGLGVICSEDENISRLTPEMDAKASIYCSQI